MSTNILVDVFGLISHLRNRTSKMVSQDPRTPQSIFTWLFLANMAEELEDPSVSRYCEDLAEKSSTTDTIEYRE